jgi:hypothetical protein
MAVSPILSLSLNARNAHSLVRLTTTWVLLRHPLSNTDGAIGGGLQHDYQILLMSSTKPGMTSPQSIEVGDSYISGSCPGR